MTMLDQLSSNPVHWGSEAIPCGAGRFGILDSIRLQEAAIPGQAAAYENSTSGDDYLNMWVFGNASARPEFFGVFMTKGSSPTLALTATTTNDNTVSVLYNGYAPCLLAQGFSVVEGQYMEPIPSGSLRGFFRPVTAGGRGPVQALESYDNSAGTAPQWVSGLVQGRPVGRGLIGASVASSAALAANTETVFSVSQALAPANTIKVGDVYRVRAKARVTIGASGDTLVIRSRLNSAAGVLLAASTSIDPAVDALILLDFEITVRTIGAGGTLSAAGIAVANTSANATGTAGTVAIDTTAANTIVVTADWSADTTDAVVLENLIVEKLN